MPPIGGLISKCTLGGVGGSAGRARGQRLFVYCRVFHSPGEFSEAHCAPLPPLLALCIFIKGIIASE